MSLHVVAPHEFPRDHHVVSAHHSKTPPYVSLWSRVKDFYSVVMTDYDSTEKGRREHKDLAMALLAHTHLQLRRKHP